MIKKDKLLNRINTLIDLEKKLIPLLNRHISSSLFFSKLKEDDRNAIIEYFQNLVITKTRHIEILNNIRDEVTGRQSDVY